MNKNLLIGIVVVILLVGGVVWLIKTPGKGGMYDSFAQCLKDKGVLFYGAFWCPHCRDQKAEFGRSDRLLPYIECSTPDGNGQLPICNEKGITSYPTWVFPDGSRISQVLPLEDLAEKSSCQLPKTSS
ncbi:hypothetical protein KW783_01925 [Candidatus Parcubacteria bacterium]|nr:hypothetical protein [Candidatus Parcubacteria bacterium]